MNKRLLIILPHEGFRDKEFAWVVERLENSGIQFAVASTHLSDAKGRFGDLVKPDVLVRQVHPDIYDGYIFIGEEAAEEYVNNPEAVKLLEHAADYSKLVGAIGHAVLVLTSSRILTGRKVTGPSDLQNRFEEAGAFFGGKLVEKDGNLITASGPYGTREFGEEIVEYFSEDEGLSGRKFLR